MTEKFIPLTDLRQQLSQLKIPTRLVEPDGFLSDAGAAIARFTHFGHRSLQLPLRVLHAKRSLR
jgi:hypothetical protein